MQTAVQILSQTSEFDTPDFDEAEVVTTMELHGLTDASWDEIPYAEQAELIDAAHQR